MRCDHTMTHDVRSKKTTGSKLRLPHAARTEKLTRTKTIITETTNNNNDNRMRAAVTTFTGSG